MAPGDCTECACPSRAEPIPLSNEEDLGVCECKCHTDPEYQIHMLQSYINILEIQILNCKKCAPLLEEQNVAKES